jgi:hypothetical protein
MIKKIIHLTSVLLLLCSMPFSATAAGSKQKRANDHLVFIGSARRYLSLDDSINAALRDAARKAAFFHSVSAEAASHESGGALNTLMYGFEIKERGDYARYLDKLEYNRKTDVFESDGAVFVRAAYRSNAGINIDYTPAQNNKKPQWVDVKPSTLGSYMAAVGYSAPRLYHSDTVTASYENAVISLIESSCTKIRTIESETNRAYNSSSLSVTAGTLTGFFVLDTWTDPVSKAVWTLAIAEGFTESEISAADPSYKWTTNLPEDTETTMYFWGFSGKSKDRREAETKALQDAKIRISGYISVAVEGGHAETSRYKNIRGHIVEDSEIIDEFSRSYTKNILEGIKPIKSQPVTNSDGSVNVQILVSVNRADLDKKRDEIDRQMTDLSRYYTSQITAEAQAGPSLETLRKYEQIAARLDPLQRSRVNYLGLAEPVNLYTYLNEQIIKLSGLVYAAHIEFKGNFSGFEQTNILNALQDGLKRNNVTLQLHNTPTNTGFIFIVSGEEEINSYNLVRWKMPGLSVQFMRGNSLLASDYVQAPAQVNREWLIDAVGKELRQRNDFYKRIKDVLERR